MQLLRLYDCLADATRLRVLALLAVQPLCVCHFEAVLRLPQARISRHLAYLRRHRVVTAEQRGPWRIYALADPRPPLLAANLAALHSAAATDPVLRRDQARLAALGDRVDCGCRRPAVPRRHLLRLSS